MAKRPGFRRIMKGLYKAPNGRDTIAYRPWAKEKKWILEWTDFFGGRHYLAFCKLREAKRHYFRMVAQV